MRDILSERKKVLSELREFNETYANTREYSTTEGDDEYERLTDQLNKLDIELFHLTPEYVYSLGEETVKEYIKHYLGRVDYYESKSGLEKDVEVIKEYENLICKYRDKADKLRKTLNLENRDKFEQIKQEKLDIAKNQLQGIKIKFNSNNGIMEEDIRHIIEQIFEIGFKSGFDVGYCSMYGELTGIKIIK